MATAYYGIEEHTWPSYNSVVLLFLRTYPKQGPRLDPSASITRALACSVPSLNNHWFITSGGDLYCLPPRGEVLNVTRTDVRAHYRARPKNSCVQEPFHGA